LEFDGPILRHPAQTLRPFDLADCALFVAVEITVGVAILNPQPLRRFQIGELRRSALGLQNANQQLVRLVQPTVPDLGAGFEALHDVDGRWLRVAHAWLIHSGAARAGVATKITAIAMAERMGFFLPQIEISEIEPRSSSNSKLTTCLPDNGSSRGVWGTRKADLQ
jgi:hypothetical protein